MKRFHLPSRRRLVTSIAAILLAPAAAFAQQQEDAPPADASDLPDSSAKTLDHVTVTGSRIPRAGFDTLEPASVVTRQNIEQQGYTNIADAMFTTPSFGAGASYYGDQSSFGAGVNFLSRFGLGSNRLLTLVNGRRFVSSNPPTIFGPAGGGTQVDLNAIPSIMVDQIETIGVGGAPTYGSDAIAGVSNILLRKNYHGAEVELGHGLTTRGDNARYDWQAIFGQNFAEGRGNITVAASFDDSEGVLNTERSYYRRGWSLQTNPNADAIAQFQPGRIPSSDGRVHGSIPFDTGPDDGIPGKVFIRNRRINTMTWGGLVLPADGRVYRDRSGQLAGLGPGNDLLQFGRDGRLLAYDAGTTFGQGNSSGGDGLDLSQTSQLVSDLKRQSVYATGSFDFSDHVSGFFEANWFHSEATELIDQNIYNAASFGTGQVDGSGDQSGSLNFSIDNPFLSEQARETLQDLGVENFRLSRSSRDLSTNNSSSTSELARVVAGLQGDFEWGGRRFNWEASINHGRGNYDYYGTGIVQQHFINAINVTRDVDGRIVCDAGAAGTVADPACQPLNLFGEGAASREALDYVTTRTHAQSETRQTVYNVNLSGSVVDLPGGELAFNVGYEQRKEDGRFMPDDYQRQGLGRSVPIEGARGAYHTNEYFGEILAPLVSAEAGIPGLHRLDLTGKVRRVENTVNGWFTAYTYGLQYEPVAGLQLRGNRTISFRSPSISELYTSNQPAYYFISEPCTSGEITGGNRPDLRRRNCQAFFDYYGADPATFEGASTSQLGGLTGSTELKNERAKSWTAGLVLQPAWARGLRVAADWYDIRITQAIAQLGPDDITSGCFDNETFDANDVPHANPFCSRINRDPATGVATGIQTYYDNGPVTQFKGWTGEVGYQLDLDAHGLGRGRLDVGFYGYFPRELASSPSPDVPMDETVGTLDAPKRQYEWRVNYLLKHWLFGVVANYTSSSVVDLNNTVDTRDFLKSDSFTRWDANIGYRASDHFKLNLSVLNVADDIGPEPFIYDALGRRFMLKATYTF